MWQELAVAFSLVLVIEGVLPFLSPRHWRQMVQAAALMNDRSLRLMGLFSMLLGLGLLYWIR